MRNSAGMEPVGFGFSSVGRVPFSSVSPCCFYVQVCFSRFYFYIFFQSKTVQIFIKSSQHFQLTLSGLIIQKIYDDDDNNQAKVNLSRSGTSLTVLDFFFHLIITLTSFYIFLCALQGSLLETKYLKRTARIVSSLKPMVETPISKVIINIIFFSYLSSSAENGHRVLTWGFKSNTDVGRPSTPNKCWFLALIELPPTALIKIHTTRRTENWTISIPIHPRNKVSMNSTNYLSSSPIYFHKHSFGDITQPSPLRLPLGYLPCAECHNQQPTFRATNRELMRTISADGRWYNGVWITLECHCRNRETMQRYQRLKVSSPLILASSAALFSYNGTLLPQNRVCHWNELITPVTLTRAMGGAVVNVLHYSAAIWSAVNCTFSWRFTYKVIPILVLRGIVLTLYIPRNICFQAVFENYSFARTDIKLLALILHFSLPFSLYVYCFQPWGHTTETSGLHIGSKKQPVTTFDYTS